MIKGAELVYYGKRNKYHTPFNKYVYIESGMHWYRELGEGVWISDDEFPDTQDVDYGVFVNKEYLNNFEMTGRIIKNGDT